VRTKRTKEPVAPATPAPVGEIERDVLIGAYKSGLISGWKRDTEQGYRLTLAGQGDKYVEVAKLTQYLDGLRKTGS
jgi:hypothetical protein